MRLTIALAMLLTAFSLAAAAASDNDGAIRVQQPWARALPPVSRNGAAYLSIHNTGGEPDRLLSAASPAAARVEIHTHEHVGGMMKMRQIDGVDLPAGQRVDFAPGGLHLMLIELRQPLTAGQDFALELEFRHAGRVPVQVRVLQDPPPATGGHAMPRH